MNRDRLIFLLLLFTLGFAGCNRPTLMPTPVAFDHGVDPIAETPSSEQDTTARVFIVTDRKPSGRTDTPGEFYSNDRDYGLRVGVWRRMDWGAGPAGRRSIQYDFASGSNRRRRGSLPISRMTRAIGVMVA